MSFIVHYQALFKYGSYLFDKCREFSITYKRGYPTQQESTKIYELN